MNTAEVVMVRVYLTEGNGQLETLVKRLHDWEKLKGLTVFRGTAGYGASGVMHSGSLVDLSLDLPVVVEFFDEPAKVETVLEHLSTFIPSGHMVRWPAQIIVD